MAPSDKTDEIKDRLEKLGQRLDSTNDKKVDEESAMRQTAQAHKKMAQGFRVAIELAVAIIVGALIGYWIDGQIGTGPWMMLAFFGLGIFAGFFNVIRTAKQMQKDAEESGAFAEAKDLPPDDDDDESDWTGRG